MDNSDIQKFAKRWIAFEAKINSEPKRTPPDDDPEWEIAFELMRLTDEDWKTALSITIEVANQSNDPGILGMLGAGPLEDLLENYGPEVLQGFLAAAKANPSFRQALQNVWECSNRYVWEKFLGVRDKLATPELPDYES